MLNDSCSTAYFKKITDKKSTQRLGEKSVYESCLPIFRKFFDSRRIVPQAPLRWKERSSRIIAGVITFFSPKGPGDYSRDGNFSKEAIISNIAHWKSFSKYFVLFSDWIKKITSTKLNMDFLSVPNLVPWLKSISSLRNFNRHWSVCWIQTPFHRDGGERDGWGRRLFEGSDDFKYFRQREAINRGAAIIRENTVIEKQDYRILYSFLS